MAADVPEDVRALRGECMASGLTVSLVRRGWGGGPVDWRAEVFQAPIEAVGPTKAAALRALADAFDLYEEVG